MSAPGERLLAVPPWGRIALSEGAEPGSAVVVTTILAVQGADLEGASGLLQRWIAFQDPMLPALTGGGLNDRLELRQAALAGSTLAELIETYGALGERQCAALFLDVITGVRRCHARRLVLGTLHVDGLFVCPPGLDDVAALRCHGAGIPLLVAAARGSLDIAGSEGAREALGPAQGVAPEVNVGRLPSATSDAWALGASMIHALLGAPAFSAQGVELLVHGQRQGLSAAQIHQLERAAPHLAAGLVQAVSTTPLLRAGALDTLEAACRQLDAERTSVHSDGGPWKLGSPLMALGAYATARPYGDRFETRTPLVVNANVDQLDDAGIDRARLDAALRQLDVQRVLSQRDHVRKERTGLKVTIVLLTAAIAAAIVWFGTRVRPQLRAVDRVVPTQLQLKRAAPPRPIKSIPLFRKGDGPVRKDNP